ncbi:MAG: polysaccharide deacetylase family protein [Nocardioidaceae bacterium]|nr:polysaccharide deacetylase family protein [Nocardioidaceae bacterium]NUS50326.1 polysaccharide deacetylase family protein [Nocardioidaceae bacterium]
MGSAPILMYHAVDTLADPMNVQVFPARLRQQLRVLRRLGMRGVSVRELLAAPSHRERLVGLTFDDGYADFATTAAPILAEFGFTASVYVVAGRLDGTNEWDPPPRRPLMTADQLRQVHRAGHEVGSHGMWHTRLRDLPAARLTEELATSRQVLEDVVGAPVTGFCYPYGDARPEVAPLVREHYDYGCAVLSRSGHRWAMPRFHVDNGDDPMRLLAKIALWPVRQRRRPVAS